MAAAKKSDQEYGIGENSDGTLNIFDEDEMPAKIAELEDFRKMIEARNKADQEITDEVASGKTDISDIDDYDDLADFPTI